MNKLLVTNPSNITALIARIVLGVVIFPHGAQKLLGWFGGGGFAGTMSFLTGGAGLPYIVALLVILIEFFGALFLIFGFLTRLSAFGVIALFSGIVVTMHSASGFFMNWGMEAGRSEGLEFFILLIGLALVLLITGGGKASIDSVLTKQNGK